MSQKRGVVVASVALATLMNGLDTTIVTISMPTILKDLGDAELYAWVVTAFAAAAASSGPAWGRLSDYLGRRRLLVTALVGFVLGSVACGVAGSMLFLVLARAVQGFFGGGLFPLAYSVVADLYPPQERARGVALINSVNAIAFAVGPVLGAAITEYVGWRWNFYVNVPILAAALILIIANYREAPREASSFRFDASGMVLFGLAVALFVVGMGVGTRHAGWGSPLVLALLGGAAATGAAFVVRERRVEHPFVPLRFLAAGPFSTSALIVMSGFSAFIGVMLFAPAYVQGVRGDSVQTMGFFQLAVVGGWFVTAAIGAKLVPRVGARATALGGVIVTMAGLGLLSTWSTETPPTVLVATLLLCGAGVGFTQPAMFVLAQTSLPPTDQGLASGLLGVSVNLGATISTAAYGTILTWSLLSRGGRDLVDRVPHLMEASERAALRESLGGGFADVVSNYDASLHLVFAAKFAPALIALVLLMFGMALWGRGIPINSPPGESGSGTGRPPAPPNPEQ